MPFHLIFDAGGMSLRGLSTVGMFSLHIPDAFLEFRVDIQPFKIRVFTYSHISHEDNFLFMSSPKR
jgi:hypothetical protein